MGMARNARNGIEAGDLFAPPSCPFSFEVKRRGRAYGTVYAALDQAQGYQVTKTPVALIRDDRREWLAVFRLADVKDYLTAGEKGCRQCCGGCAQERVSDQLDLASVAEKRPKERTTMIGEHGPGGC